MPPPLDTWACLSSGPAGAVVGDKYNRSDGHRWRGHEMTFKQRDIQKYSPINHPCCCLAGVPRAAFCTQHNENKTSCANKRLTLAGRYAEVNFQDTSWTHRGNIWTQRQRRGPDHSTGRCSWVQEANNIQSYMVEPEQHATSSFCWATG